MSAVNTPACQAGSAGSNPVRTASWASARGPSPRGRPDGRRGVDHASVAHSEEHSLGMGEAPGSIPGSSSMRITRFDIANWRIFEKAKAFKGPKGPHPPYTIHKIGGFFFVKNSLGMRKNKKGYKTHAEAEALQRALYAALPPDMK